MKTAISIPDEVFNRAEEAAEHLGWSRSQLYTRAMNEFLERHDTADPVTAVLNEIADESAAEPAPATGRSLIDSGLWEW